MVVDPASGDGGDNPNPNFTANRKMSCSDFDSEPFCDDVLLAALTMIE